MKETEKAYHVAMERNHLFIIKFCLLPCFSSKRWF